MLDLVYRNIIPLILRYITSPKDVLSLHLTSKDMSRFVYESIEEIREPPFSPNHHLLKYKKEILITKKPRCIRCRRERAPTEIYCSVDMRSESKIMFSYDPLRKKVIKILIETNGIFGGYCFTSMCEKNDINIGEPRIEGEERLAFCGHDVSIGNSGRLDVLDLHEDFEALFSYGFFVYNKLDHDSPLYHKEEDVPISN